jgi:hypothetical protein
MRAEDQQVAQANMPANAMMVIFVERGVLEKWRPRCPGAAEVDVQKYETLYRQIRGPTPRSSYGETIHLVIGSTTYDVFRQIKVMTLPGKRGAREQAASQHSLRSSTELS